MEVFFFNTLRVIRIFFPLFPRAGIMEVLNKEKNCKIFSMQQDGGRKKSFPPQIPSMQCQDCESIQLNALSLHAAYLATEIYNWILATLL